MSNFQPTLPMGGQAGQSTNPWFTISNQFVPRNLHDVIRWARYITIQSPTTSEVIRKLATYPITDFNIDTTKDSVKTKYRHVLKSFKLKEALQNVGFEYFTIGNCFISIYFPIHRTLTCPTCKTAWSAKKADFIKFKQFAFTGECPHCGYKGVFKRTDTKSMNIDDMNIVKWNPEHIAVNHNPITGESEYYYTIPNAVKQKIIKGDKLFVNSIPWGFVEAVRYNQDFKFDQNNIFHLKNVTTGGTVDGVSVPPLLSLFSLVFYQATLRKANEAIATEYLNPLRVVYPQAQTGNSDPVISMSLRNFASNMEDAFRKHKQDKNHIVFAPVPVGYNAIGAEGKNLLVSQEIQQAEEAILISLGVSKELLSGTSNWTSTSVGLRMMENLLFGYVSRLQDLIDWTMTKVSTYLSIEEAEVTLQPFKLLDDEVHKQLLAQLSQGGGCSEGTFFDEIGLDFNKEQDKIKEEAVLKARKQVETQYESEQAQAMAAKKKGDDMNEDEEYKTLLDKAQAMADQLYQADEGVRRSFINKLKTADYTMYLMVSKLIDEANATSEHQAEVQQGAAQEVVSQDKQGNLPTEQEKK